MLIKVASTDGDTLSFTAITIFGVSMILLYTSSAIYHTVIGKDRIIQFLRRLDHSMIYLLIAGTYAPFCLIALQGSTGYMLFSIISLHSY